MIARLQGCFGVPSLPALVAVLAAGVGAAPSAGVAATPEGDTSRVSVSSTEQQSNRSSYDSAITADGRYVAFSSAASNLVPGDTNAHHDVFVRDRKLGTTRRVSVSSNGHQANGTSGALAISEDGRFIAFSSFASNLVHRDTNLLIDVFVRDRRLGTTRRVSVSSNGHQANGTSGELAMSADGRFVAFSSDASNLVPGDTNTQTDVFVRDRELGTTRRVSVSSAEDPGNDGSQDPAISAGGRYVVFSSYASNLVPGDTNTQYDVFVRDRKLGTTRLVNVSSTEHPGNEGGEGPVVSAHGRFVAFTSLASNLVPGDTNGRVDVFVRDLKLGATRRVSVSGTEHQADSYNINPAISAGGRYVVFTSYASNLVPGDTNNRADVFVRDRKLGTTRRVSVSSTGHQSIGDSINPAISSGGRYVVFSSYASNLVLGDTNHRTDVFVRDRGATP